MTSEACRVADDLPDPARRFAAHSARWLNAIERGDGRGVIEHHARLDREVRLSPHATHRWQHLSHTATMLTLRGDLAGADAAAEAALALGTDTGQPDAMTQFAVQVTVIRCHQGRLHEMIPVIEQAILDVPALVAYQAALAYACAMGGDETSAVRHLDRAIDHGFTTPEDSAWSTAHAAWAETAVRTGRHASAPVLRDRLSPFHAQLVATTLTVLPAFAHVLGRLDHLSGPIRRRRRVVHEAMQIHEQLDSPLLIAYTNAAWAEMLAERDHADDRAQAVVKAQDALAPRSPGALATSKPTLGGSSTAVCPRTRSALGRWRRPLPGRSSSTPRSRS